MDGDTLRLIVEGLAPVAGVYLAAHVGRLFGLGRRRWGFIST